MLYKVLIILSLIGAPALAVLAVFLRLKKRTPDTAGYVYNGKKWVAWLYGLCVLGVIIMLLMGLTTGGHKPEWGILWMLLIATLLFACYSIIAFKPVNEEQLVEAQNSGNTVLSNVGGAALSMASALGAALLGVLAALPGMLYNALNPVLAVKQIGGVMYKVVGTGFMHIMSGIVALVALAVAVVFVVYLLGIAFAIFGTFVLGIIAIVKFVQNYIKYKDGPVVEAVPAE
jgi:hypothetical protein